MLPVMNESNTDDSINKYFLEDPSLIQHMSQKQNKKIILYDLPKIDQYRRLTKPVVSQEKKIMIKEKLDLEQQSLLQCKEREKRNEFFLNYSQNPLINLQPHKLQHYGKDNEDGQQNKPKMQNIIHELNHLKEKTHPDFVKKKENFNSIRRDAGLLSQKILENSYKKKSFSYFEGFKPKIDDLIRDIFETGKQLKESKRLEEINRPINPPQSSQNKQNDVITNPAVSDLPENPLSFDQIIAIKEENFFMKSNKKTNIFKFAVGNKDLIEKELLNRYYFNFVHMYQKLQKIKIPVYRDISRMSRRIMLGSSIVQNIQDYIDPYELSFNASSLRFQDIMSVASRRFSSQYVAEVTGNFDMEQNTKEKSQTSSMADKQQINYEKNTENKQVRFHNQGEQQQQIKNYLRLELNTIEMDYARKCNKYERSISKELSEKQQLIRSTIQDRQLHSILDHNIRNQMSSLIMLDKDDTDVDRLVRKNKAKKDKNVSIKIEALLDTFAMKNRHEKVIGGLGKQTRGMKETIDHINSKSGKEKLKDDKNSIIINKSQDNNYYNIYQYDEANLYKDGKEYSNNTNKHNNINSNRKAWGGGAGAATVRKGHGIINNNDNQRGKGVRNPQRHALTPTTEKKKKNQPPLSNIWR